MINEMKNFYGIFISQVIQKANKKSHRNSAQKEF